MEYASEFDRATDIYLREYEIECNKLYTLFLMESCSDDSYVDEQRALMEAEEGSSGEYKPKSKFVSFISALCKKIRQVFVDIGEMIANIFSSKPDPTSEDIKASKAFTEAEAARLAEIDEELKKSRKVVYAISKVTENVGIDYDQVANFLDSKAKRLRESDGLKVAGAAVGATVGYAIFRRITHSGEAALKDIENTAQKIQGNQEAEKTLGKVADKIRKLASEGYKIAAKAGNAVKTVGGAATSAVFAADDNVRKQEKKAVKQARKVGN